MKVDGRCHCGQITYEAIIDPEKIAICHCTDCQMLTGSAYRTTVPAPSATFTLRSGQPKTYVKTAESGAKRIHAFCPNCGTPIYSAAISDPPAYSLRVGCLQQRSTLRPAKQQWCKSALSWVMNLQGIPQISRQ